MATVGADPGDVPESSAVLETRCPTCSASLRPGAPWCTLCYADLRPAPEPEPAVVVVPPVAVPPAAAYAAPAADPLAPVPAATAAAEPTWPCATCGASNPLTLSACGACGAGFLARLRETEAPLLELPVVGDLGAMSRGQRIGLAFGVVLAVVALVALLGVLFS